MPEKDTIETNGAPRMTLQKFSDEVVAPEFRQPLKTAQEVVDAHGWGRTDAPMCCEQKVRTESMIGSPYYAECEKCGKWAASMDGPQFSKSGSSVTFLDGDKVDLEVDATWIIGDHKPSEVAHA